MIIDDVQPKKPFETALAELINSYSLENYSETPDFILAQYMRDCLKAYESACEKKKWWHRKEELKDR